MAFYFPQQWSSGYQYGGQMSTGCFNPSTPAFHPSSVELQRAQPRSAADPSVKEMQKWIAETASNQLMNIASIERKTHDNSQELQQLRSVVISDLRTLNGQIADLKAAMAEKSLACVSLTTKTIEPVETHERVFDKEELARAYLDEALEKDTAASELRKLAEDLLNRPVGNESTGPKLLEAPGPGDKVIGFACCGIAFGAIHEMLDHIDVAHLQPMAVMPPSTPPTATMTKLSSSARSYARSHESVEIQSTTSVREAQEAQGKAVLMATITPVTEPSWIPSAVHRMEPLAGKVPSEHVETFSAELLQELFKGNDFCDGFHFMPDPLDLGGIRSYWILEEDFQPYLPTSPGQHGAKLTPLSNDAPVANPRDVPDIEHFMNVPVFIRTKDGPGYRYFGHYSQNRFRDKIGFDTLMEKVPEAIRRHWASALAEAGRPDWVSQMLISHFFPRPEYCGPIPTDSAVNTPRSGAASSSASIEPLERHVKERLSTYAYELKEWEQCSHISVSLLTEQEIFDAFSNADGDVVPGLRPWWEYFECVNYDVDFYKFLLHFKNNPQQAAKPAKPTLKPQPRKETTAEREARLKQAAIDAAKPTQFVKHNFFHPPPAPPRPEFKGTPPHKLAAAGKKDHPKGNKSWKTQDGNNDKESKQSDAAAAAVEGKKAADNDSWSISMKSSASAAVTQRRQSWDEKSGTGWQGFGDVEMAKAMSNDFKNGVASKRRSDNYVPPHLRGR